MKNKLLLTTALAGVVAFSGVASAELKVGVSHEATFASSSMNGTGINSNRVIGSETNLLLRGKKDLTNGFNVGLNFNYEMDNGDTREFQLIVGNSTADVIVGNDLTQGINITAVPRVGEHIGSVAGRGAAIIYQDAINPDENNQNDHVGLQFKNVAGGNLVALYSPSNGSQQDDGTRASLAAGGSGTTISYLGKPIEGLTIGLAHATKQEDQKAIAATGGKDTEKAYSIAYSTGKFSAGIEKRTFDDGSTANIDYDGMHYGITASISDNLSVGLNYTVLDRDGAANNLPDEKVKLISLGYNFGGLGLELSYADIENASNSNDPNNDGNVIQLRTVASF